MDDNYISTTAVFGEVRRNVLSKDFKSGKLTNLFARTTIDFGHADINGTVVLDCNQLFGDQDKSTVRLADYKQYGQYITGSEG